MVYIAISPSSSMSTFISEFTTLIDDLNSSPSELIITGDFNIHVDKPTLPDPSTFLSTLDSADLRQHVKFPTHKYGHTLDLLISRATSNIISTVEWTIPFISDHYAIQATLTIPSYSRPPLSPNLFVPFDQLMSHHCLMTYITLLCTHLLLPRLQLMAILPCSHLLYPLSLINTPHSK